MVFVSRIDASRSTWNAAEPSKAGSPGDSAAALVAEATQRRCHLVLVALGVLAAAAVVAASVADTRASTVAVGEEASVEDLAAVVVVSVEATEEVTATLALAEIETAMALPEMPRQDLAVMTGETVTVTATVDMEAAATTIEIATVTVIVIVTATVAAMATAMAAGPEATWSQLAAETVGIVTGGTETTTDPGTMTTESVVMREGATKTLANCVVTSLSTAAWQVCNCRKFPHTRKPNSFACVAKCQTGSIGRFIFQRI